MLNSFADGHMTESWRVPYCTQTLSMRNVPDITSCFRNVCICLMNNICIFMISPANFQAPSSNVSLATVTRSKAKQIKVTFFVRMNVGRTLKLQIFLRYKNPYLLDPTLSGANNAPLLSLCVHHVINNYRQFWKPRLLSLYQLGQQMFCFSIVSRPALRLIHPPTHSVPGALSLWGKPSRT